ncbi:MAG TPA: NADH-ubiquinone oxidoreductase-F iron-sulfur binding region domain-containing protein [Candidatus Dormibacteraeota bacterium]|nr:NADH-ubiquinone oxidoreductase-F iron-sulfur binding region domain-containing protein [Candidatus Dormibacteraeota bacterium]
MPRPDTACWRLLSGPAGPGAEPLPQHLTRLGRRPSGGTWLMDVLDASNLRGRGGAGFPTGRKWRSVAAGSRGDAVVVVNLAEGEPASFKDRTLGALRPHLILDGAALAVESVAASRAIVYVGREHSAAREALRFAAGERRRLNRDECGFEIVDAPARYVAGETSALVNRLNGGPAKPTMTPPRPHQVGVLGRPTLIQNAETLAHVALIARYGADWFRQVGTVESPGTALVTVLGAVVRPSVIEVDRGATVGEVIDAAGGLVRAAQAVLLGGYFGTWVPANEAWSLRLEDQELASHGTSLGCGVVMVLPTTSCGVAESARILRYLAGESAGQCGPCVFGLDWIASAMERAALGRTDRSDRDRLVRWAGQVSHRGACHHPDGAVRLLNSALRVFEGDLALHLVRQPCRSSRVASTILPPAPGRTEWH